MFMTIEGLFIIYFIRLTTTDPNFTNGYSLANSLLILLSNSIIFSLNGGMMARISQAFGNHDPELCGLYFHRGSIINISLTIPLMIPLFFTENILISIGSSPAEASIAQTYINYKIPAVMLNTIYFSFMSVYYGCRNFKVPAGIQAVSVTIGIVLTYLFLVQWGWGIAGIGIATDISNLLSVLIILIHAKWYEPVEGVFFKPRKESYEEIWSLLKF
jgi:MATE family multidrug resistance protein